MPTPATVPTPNTAGAGQGHRPPVDDTLLVEALSGRGVRSVYQPIVDLERLVVVGFEALTRFDLCPGTTPDQFFAAAARRDLLAELEAVTLRSALAKRPDLPRNTFLTVNLEPESLFADSVRRVFDEQDDLRGIVVEVTEHRPLGDPVAVGARLDELRARGALVAVDDAGAGYAGLEQILTLRPSVLKLDRSLVADVDRDDTKAALIEMLGLFASRIDAWLLAEGIETEPEARRLMQLGVPLAQGYLFARPEPAWATIDARVQSRLETSRSRNAVRPLLCLVESCPTAGHDDVEGARSAILTGATRVVILLDDHGRPVGLMDRSSVLGGSVHEPLRVNVSATPGQLAGRLATRPATTPLSPVAATDDTGRFLGIVRVERLLAHLAGRDDRTGVPAGS